MITIAVIAGIHAFLFLCFAMKRPFAVSLLICGIAIFARFAV